MLLHFIFVIKKQEIEKHSWEFEYIEKMAKFFKFWIEKTFSKKVNILVDLMPIEHSFLHRINMGSLLEDHRSRGEDIFHFYLTYFRPLWTDCTCEGYHAENFGLVWWQTGSPNDFNFLAEKNCATVSHEISHEFLRQENNKNYIEMVHEIWTKHLFASLPYERYDENFEKTTTLSIFATIDSSQFWL